jgi:hypothetical protein
LLLFSPNLALSVETALWLRRVEKLAATGEVVPVICAAKPEDFEDIQTKGPFGVSESAGINRHGVADERAVQERASDPS